MINGTKKGPKKGEFGNLDGDGINSDCGRKVEQTCRSRLTFLNTEAKKC